MIQHTVKFDRPIANVCLANGTAPSEASAVGDNAHLDSTIDVAEAVDQKKKLEQVESLLSQISQTAKQLLVESEKSHQESKAFAVRLATLICKTIVGESNSIQQERLVSLVDVAFQSPESVLNIHTNDNGRELLQAALDDSETNWGELDIKADTSVPAGEIRIEFSKHELMSNLDFQLEQVESRLLEVIHGND